MCKFLQMGHFIPRLSLLGYEWADRARGSWELQKDNGPVNFRQERCGRIEVKIQLRDRAARVDHDKKLRS